VREPAPEYGVIVIDDKDGFRVVQPDSVLASRCIQEELRGDASVVAVTRATPVSFDSPIVAYFADGDENDSKESGMCSDFLGEIGLVWASERPRRAVIVRQKTEYATPICLTALDIKKLRHLFLRYERQIVRDAAFDKLEEDAPEPEYSEDSLDASMSEFYSPPSEDGEEDDDDDDSSVNM
jgi:hypothetical protein